MAPRYDELAVTALRLNPTKPIERTYYLMRFPGRWKEPLRQLAQAKRSGKVAGIPIKSLNKAITALVPDCVVTLTYASRGNDDEEWLLAYQAVNPKAIFNLVAAWVRSQQGTPEQIKSTLTQLQASDLTWSPVRINLNTDQDYRRTIRLLPMEIAARLSRPESVCPHNQLRFLRCPTERGAEVMSWPPAGLEEGNPFSIKIGITVQTLPTSKELFAYFSYGVRRWMSAHGNLAFDHGHSVYITPTVPYLKDLENSRHFGRAQIRRMKDASTGEYGPRWNDELAGVLQEAGCLEHLPSPQQLVEKPLDYLQLDSNAAGLVYSTGMLSKEKVSAGLSLADRAPLMAWVSDELDPHLQPVDLLPREKCTVYRGFGDTSETPIPADHLRDALDKTRLEIELLTDTDLATKYALDQLARRLGKPMPSVNQLKDAEALIDLDDLTIRVRRLSAQGILGDLDRKGRTHQAATEARIKEITDHFNKVPHPTVTLVEISHPDAYGKRRGDDPKFAIRHGLLRTGRLTQFVTPVTESKPSKRTRAGREPSDANRERFRAAIDELFRQLGVRPQPLPEPTQGTLARRPALLGLWMIRKNKNSLRRVAHQVPIAVLSDPTGRHIQICAPGVDWQPLHEGLLAIGEKYANVNLRCGPDEVVRFTKRVIREALEAFSDSDTLLLTHAQNFRSVWKTIMNKELQLDMFEFGAGDLQPMSHFPNLRHVRIRTAADGETPECYGINNEEIGQPKGLWRFWLPRVYGSTSGKPSTHSNTVKGVSKITPGERGEKITAPRPNAQVWNPQFIEILVAGIQDGDQPEHWAALTHDLRSGAPYVRDATILPWPLHLARQAEEYLLPTAVKIQGEETPEGEQTTE